MTDPTRHAYQPYTDKSGQTYCAVIGCAEDEWHPIHDQPTLADRLEHIAFLADGDTSDSGYLTPDEIAALRLSAKALREKDRRIAELEAKLAEERQNHADLMHKMGHR